MKELLLRLWNIVVCIWSIEHLCIHTLRKKSAANGFYIFEYCVTPFYTSFFFILPLLLVIVNSSAYSWNDFPCCLYFAMIEKCSVDSNDRDADGVYILQFRMVSNSVSQSVSLLTTLSFCIRSSMCTLHTFPWMCAFISTSPLERSSPGVLFNI